MPPQAKNAVTEWIKLLLIPVVSGVVTAAYAVGAFRGDLQRLEQRVETNRAYAEQSLANAISVRKADQAAVILDLEATKAILRDTIPILKELSKGQAKTQEAVARLEVSVSYISKTVDDLKAERIERPAKQ